jgi:ABC-2 type transport system ATP-binding protein
LGVGEDGERQAIRQLLQVNPNPLRGPLLHSGLPHQPGPAGIPAGTMAIDVSPPTQHGLVPAIETRGLTKRYKGVAALDGVDLTAPATAIGLLGANGAGKSTLIKLLLGLITPDEGDALVFGANVARDPVAVRRMVGYMPEGDCLPGDATAADFVAHMAEVAGLPSRAARQRAADVLYQVGLDEERYRLIKGFSTGMKQRVKLAQAIVHDPKLVMLDEPTAGMDPQGRDEMLALVARIHEMMGISVVLSSHILDDIERVCRYVVILDQGQVVASQPMESIDAGGGDLLVRIDGDRAAFIARVCELGAEARPAGEAHGMDEVIVRRDGDAAYDAVRDAASDLGMPLRSLQARTRSLEDLYFGNVGGGR